MPKALPDIATLLAAYASGFFPMPEPDDEEILWYRPDPRAILPLDGFHCSRSLAKTLRTAGFNFTTDQSFRLVMENRAKREDTWILPTFLERYTQLFKAGFAHSVEVWKDEKLVGGVYGVSLQGAFFAESKFHLARDASKAALFHLVEKLRAGGFSLLEVQFLTPHLKTLGAIEISDSQYQKILQAAMRKQGHFSN